MELKSINPAKHALSLVEEFKSFAFKGNVVDLAVGVIIGGAFGNIVNSLVHNVIMPLIGVVLPSEHGYDNWVLNVRGKTIPYGRFIGDIVNFLVVASRDLSVHRQVPGLDHEVPRTAGQDPSPDKGPGAPDRDPRPAQGRPSSPARRIEHLLGADVLHQFRGPHEKRLQRLALTKKLLGLVVPVTAFLVVAFTQGDDRVRLRRIGENNDLRRRLPGMADLLLPVRRGAKLIARGVAMPAS